MRDRGIAILIALVGGVFGIHHFYLGNSTSGIITLSCVALSFITSFVLVGLIGIFILQIFALVNSIQLALMTDDEFNNKYNNGKE